MLLKAEDSATFHSSITQKDAEVWASYSVQGLVTVSKSNRLML